jgi:hypothetical protein
MKVGRYWVNCVHTERKIKQKTYIFLLFLSLLFTVTKTNSAVDNSFPNCISLKNKIIQREDISNYKFTITKDLITESFENKETVGMFFHMTIKIKNGFTFDLEKDFIYIDSNKLTLKVIINNSFKIVSSDGKEDEIPLRIMNVQNIKDTKIYHLRFKVNIYLRNKLIYLLPLANVPTSNTLFLEEISLYNFQINEQTTDLFEILYGENNIYSIRISTLIVCDKIVSLSQFNDLYGGIANLKQSLNFFMEPSNSKVLVNRSELEIPPARNGNQDSSFGSLYSMFSSRTRRPQWFLATNNYEYLAWDITSVYSLDLPSFSIFMNFKLFFRGIGREDEVNNRFEVFMLSDKYVDEITGEQNSVLKTPFFKVVIKFIAIHDFSDVLMNGNYGGNHVEYVFMILDSEDDVKIQYSFTDGIGENSYQLTPRSLKLTVIPNSNYSFFLILEIYDKYNIRINNLTEILIENKVSIEEMRTIILGNPNHIAEYTSPKFLLNIHDLQLFEGSSFIKTNNETEIRAFDLTRKHLVGCKMDLFAYGVFKEPQVEEVYETNSYLKNACIEESVGIPCSVDNCEICLENVCMVCESEYYLEGNECVINSYGYDYFNRSENGFDEAATSDYTIDNNKVQNVFLNSEIIELKVDLINDNLGSDFEYDISNETTTQFSIQNFFDIPISNFKLIHKSIVGYFGLNSFTQKYVYAFKTTKYNFHFSHDSSSNIVFTIKELENVCKSPNIHKSFKRVYELMFCAGFISDWTSSSFWPSQVESLKESTYYSGFSNNLNFKKYFLFKCPEFSVCQNSPYNASYLCPKNFVLTQIYSTPKVMFCVEKIVPNNNTNIEDKFNITVDINKTSNGNTNIQKIFSNKRIVKECKRSLILNSGKCLKCSSNCQECEFLNGIPYKCLKCQENFILSPNSMCFNIKKYNKKQTKNKTNSKCTEYFYFSKVFKKCKACKKQNCKKCNDSKCLQCESDYFLEDGLCTKCNIPNCSLCKHGLCIQCKSKYFLQNDQCLPCPENCLRCSSSSTCQKCENKFNLTPNNTCVAQCRTSTEYFNQFTSTCELCLSCAFCHSPLASTISCPSCSKCLPECIFSFIKINSSEFKLVSKDLNFTHALIQNKSKLVDFKISPYEIKFNVQNSFKSSEIKISSQSIGQRSCRMTPENIILRFPLNPPMITNISAGKTIALTHSLIMTSCILTSNVLNPYISYLMHIINDEFLLLYTFIPGTGSSGFTSFLNSLFQNRIEYEIVDYPLYLYVEFRSYLYNITYVSFLSTKLITIIFYFVVLFLLTFFYRSKQEQQVFEFFPLFKSKCMDKQFMKKFFKSFKKKVSTKKTNMIILYLNNKKKILNASKFRKFWSKILKLIYKTRFLSGYIILRLGGLTLTHLMAKSIRFLMHSPKKLSLHILCYFYHFSFCALFFLVIERFLILKENIKFLIKKKKIKYLIEYINYMNNLGYTVYEFGFVYLLILFAGKISFDFIFVIILLLFVIGLVIDFKLTKFYDYILSAKWCSQVFIMLLLNLSQLKNGGEEFLIHDFTFALINIINLVVFMYCIITKRNLKHVKEMILKAEKRR